MYECIICEMEHTDNEEIYYKHRRFNVVKAKNLEPNILRILRDSDTLEELYEKWQVIKLLGVIRNKNSMFYIKGAPGSNNPFAYRFGYVYFIQGIDGGLIKIGVSINPENRLKDIQYYSPIPLRILCYIKGGRKKETELHRQFKAERQHGEWFEPSKRLLKFISDL